MSFRSRCTACRLFLLALLWVAPEHLFGQSVMLIDGITVVEDNGTLLTHDRSLPLRSLTSIKLRPNAQASFDVASATLAWQDDVGRIVVDRVQGDDWVLVPLDFEFPFGGRIYRNLRISRRGCITLGDGVGYPIMSFSEVGWERQYELIDAVSDATPRICPLFSAPIHSTPHRYTSAYSRVGRDGAVFTWRGRGFDPTQFGEVSFQIVLSQNGEIVFNYGQLEGVQYGGVLAITGREAWWTSERPVAQLSDPSTVSGGRLRSAELVQRADTNVLVARFVTGAANVPVTGTFGVEFLEEGTTVRTGRVFASTDTQGWKQSLELARRNWPIEFRTGARVTRDTLEFTIPLEDFARSPDSRVTARFYLCDPSCLVFTTSNLQLPASRDVRVNLHDSSAAGSHGLVLNVYTLPTIHLSGVRDLLVRQFGANWDHVFVYPSFENGDGGATAGGNPGVDGIGTRSSSSRPVVADVTVNSYLPASLSEYNACNYLQHGFGHRWLFYVSLMEGGARTTSLNPDSIHPSQYVHTPAAYPVTSSREWSAMGGRYWNENSDGTFTGPTGSAVNCGYSWMELYLMGLASPSEVPNWFYIGNPSPIAGTPNVRGTKVVVNIQQIIDATGARVPDHNGSKKEFTVPFLLLHRQGGRTTAEQLQRIQQLRTNFVASFEKAVGGRARIRSSFQ